jgi:hypothetical protein
MSLAPLNGRWRRHCRPGRDAVAMSWIKSSHRGPQRRFMFMSHASRSTNWRYRVDRVLSAERWVDSRAETRLRRGRKR